VPEPDRPLAVLGATGYTGRLICGKARELHVPLRLVGRRREALEAMAEPGEEIRVADAKDERALRAALEGAFAVASCAGPFLEVGTAPVSAAIAVGAHYLDTSGEQPFGRLVYEQFGPEAERREVVLLTSFGFDYVPGDLAARLAAEGLEPLDEIVVAYSVADVASSRGTRRTVGRILRQPLVAWSGGRLVPSRFGATTRRVRFPFGEREVVEWGGTEPLSVPRHTDVREVRSYVRGPRIAARAAPLARAFAPLVRLSASIGSPGPSEERRRKARFTVVAEARGPSGERRTTLGGTDVYGLTALLIVRAVEVLSRGEARGAGALAPAEAFDVHTFVEQLSPLLVLDPL
jgi:short subunit dehydrogenase-like uncharacterized protein